MTIPRPHNTTETIHHKALHPPLLGHTESLPDQRYEFGTKVNLEETFLNTGDTSKLGYTKKSFGSHWSTVIAELKCTR